MIPSGVRNQKLKLLIVVLLAGCLLITQNSLANSTDPPMFDWLNKVFVNLYGGINMIQMKDGSTICIGDISAEKMDSSGNIVWEKQLSNTRSSGFSLKDVCLAKDGGYVFLAVYSTSVNDKAYLIKLDNAGNQLWDRTLSGNKTGENTDKLIKICDIEDGGFILGGTTNPGNGVSILRTNAQGDSVWSYTYKKDKPLEITGLLQTSDGGYIIIGNSLTEYYKPVAPWGGVGGTYRDGFILKVDKIGQKEWESAWNESLHTSANYIHETGDGGFIIGGGIAVNDEKKQAYLLKLNQDGTAKWNKVLPSEESIIVTYIKQASDNGFLVLAGPVIFKVDQNGDEEWKKTSFGHNMSIMEAPDGYLTVGVDSKPPGIYYFTAHKLSWDTKTILQRNYNQLNNQAKVGYILNLYDLQISKLEKNVDKFKKLKMTAQDKAKINQELSAFEKTVEKMQRELESTAAFEVLVDYLYKSCHPFSTIYWDLKLQYSILAETQVDKHIYIPDELQKRYGNKNKVSGKKMDGIVVTKVNSFYNLDLRNVKKYTITDNRIDIVTKNKTYFLRTDLAQQFPTYVGLGISLENYKYVFNTSGFKKPVANDWILINDVIRYLMDQPKKKSLKYKDLVITKEKGEIYNIKISRVYNGPNDQYFMPGGAWNSSSNYFGITTKTPAVTYFISMADSLESIINGPNAVVKFKDCTYKVKVLK